MITVAYLTVKNCNKNESYKTAESSENKVQEQHIADGARRNRQEHLAFPEVDAGGYRNADQLGQAVRALQKIDVFQTINDKHSEHGGGQDLAEVADKGGRLTVLAEHDKRQKTGQHGPGNTKKNGDDLLRDCHHFFTSAFSSGFFSRARMVTTAIIAGRRKESAPNRTRQRSDAPSPIRAGIWHFSLSH